MGYGQPPRFHAVHPGANHLRTLNVVLRTGLAPGICSHQFTGMDINEKSFQTMNSKLYIHRWFGRLRISLVGYIIPRSTDKGRGTLPRPTRATPNWHPSRSVTAAPPLPRRLSQLSPHNRGTSSVCPPALTAGTLTAGARPLPARPHSWGPPATMRSTVSTPTYRPPSINLVKFCAAAAA